MALLKATQPQADLSLQALMFRIEQIEARLEGREERPAQPAAASSSSPAAGSSSSPAAAPRQSSVGAATAVAVESRPREESQPVGAVELERLVALWPAVAETVAAENPMLGAGLEAARPVGVEGDRLTIAFPADAAFVRKKAEASRELVAGAVRGLTGYAVGLAFQLSDDPIPAGEATLDHERLIERLRKEFGAEELFDEPDEEKR
jgi:hypothetical protein